MFAQYSPNLAQKTSIVQVLPFKQATESLTKVNCLLHALDRQLPVVDDTDFSRKLGSGYECTFHNPTRATCTHMSMRNALLLSI